MITAAEARAMAKKVFTEKEIEQYIIMMAKGDALAWAKNGSISNELKYKLEANGFTVRYGETDTTLLIIEWK